jgi:hypothetical protein
MSKPDINDKILKDAQYRKGLSIAFFNATNSAIALTVPKCQEFTEEQILNQVKAYRAVFLEEHKNYYATVIANVGINYRSEESIEKLKATDTLEDLQTVWRLLSEDERRDGEIIKVAKELRAKYTK